MWLPPTEWKGFRGIARREKKLTRMVNQAKLKSFRTAPRFKYGFEVPRDYEHALRLDKQSGTDRWQKATDLELSQIDEYKTFEDKGHKSKVGPPKGYKKINSRHDVVKLPSCAAKGTPGTSQAYLQIPRQDAARGGSFPNRRT